jgi:microsomal dipeptidase-like Zn-dependent dipeptidase
VRTVKFIRNKLSDDAVAKMIASFGGVATLNLSQNFLTEQTLIHLANARNNMPALKTVILSQNKIIERKHK